MNPGPFRILEKNPDRHEHSGIAVQWNNNMKHNNTLLFGLMLSAQVKQFQSCRVVSWVYLVLQAMRRKCLAQGHNTGPLVRFKPTTLRSRVSNSTDWVNGCPLILLCN